MADRICETFMKSLLCVIMDDYFIETHSEAGTALTTLYCALRSKNDLPVQVLFGALPNITPQHMSNFETLLVGSRSLRHQRSALLELIRIAKTNELDASEESELKDRKKQLEEASVQMKKRITSSDILNDPFTENGALDKLCDTE